jgi:succinate dehydrogenase / fumarate reductase flavoprotein subunit
MQFDAKIPAGALTDKWDRHRFELKLVNPANKRKFEIIVVGTGLAGASASASLAELGYHVKTFCIQDSPRRAHSIAAQGGINAAKNYTNEGDSIWRLFYDTVKGGDFRAREANVYRLAQLSNLIIDHCVAQGIPFARDYGGLLANRSFGGSQVSRTFYARGQTGQQLLLGAYSALMRQVGAGGVTLFPRRELLDLVLVNDQARGIVVRNLINGQLERHAADAVVMSTGGYGNIYYLSTNAEASNVGAIFRAYKRGAMFANPCFTQIHPTCIPHTGDHQSKLTLMSESLRNEGRVWVPHNPDPSFGNLVPRDVASRASKAQCDDGKGVGLTRCAVYLDFADAINRDGKDIIAKKYGNLFDMYELITDDSPYEKPMMIYPASHYTMGGLWVDYNLMSTIPGLFVLGEANFSDHGANRLGASALMQGLADGYFVIPYTIGGYFAGTELSPVSADHAAFKDTSQSATENIAKLMSVKGKRTVDNFARELGQIMWNYCGMSRNDAGLKKALGLIQDLRSEFWENVLVPGTDEDYNKSLEKAGRQADSLEFAELMILDALDRSESCGGHFREESQTEEGEAQRDDENFSHVSIWEYEGYGEQPKFHKEPLVFENVELSQRSYK